MLRKKIVGAVGVIVVSLGLADGAMAQSIKGLYGNAPCGFTEVLPRDEPGPGWRIDFKEWESDACIKERKIYEIKPDPQREERLRQIEGQHATAERIRDQMESALSAAEVGHAGVKTNLHEADRLYQVEVSRLSGEKDWTAYKAQLRVVERLRSSYEKHKATYIAVRGKYESQAASLMKLQAIEKAS